jgi:hypothetical protein
MLDPRTEFSQWQPGAVDAYANRMLGFSEFKMPVEVPKSTHIRIAASV